LIRIVWQFLEARVGSAQEFYFLHKSSFSFL
jgi:hypothetical protein